MDEQATQASMSDLDLHDPAQRGEIKRAVEALPGMVAVRLVAGFDRPVDELHVLVTLDRAPKQVVRDVQSLLYARFDLSIDHRVISVVQLAEDDPMRTPSDVARPRVQLARTSVTQTAADATVTVVVVDEDGIEHVGTASGDVAPAVQRDLAATASLHALSDLLAEAATVTLAGMTLLPLGGTEVALAAIDVRASRSSLTLTGSAVVRRGEVDAIARAVLDALNRILAHR